MSGGKCSTFSDERKFPADEVVALASRAAWGWKCRMATAP